MDYWGDVAVHFVNSQEPLLLPVSNEAYLELTKYLDRQADCIEVDTVDNRKVLIRLDAVSDMMMASDCSSTDYPEGDGYPSTGQLLASKVFWLAHEVAGDHDDSGCIGLRRDSREDVFGERERAEGRQFLAEIDANRQSSDEVRRNLKLANTVEWRCSNGVSRQYRIAEDTDLVGFLAQFDQKNRAPRSVKLTLDGPDAEVVMRWASMDYVSMPLHRLAPD